MTTANAHHERLAAEKADILARGHKKALEIARDNAGFDGAMHKQWVIDQMVRALCGSEDQYRIFVTNYEAGEDGPQTYEWDTGVAP
jgi:hypothetical protein